MVLIGPGNVPRRHPDDGLAWPLSTFRRKDSSRPCGPACSGLLDSHKMPNAGTGPCGTLAGMRILLAGVRAASFALCGLLASAEPAIGPAIRKGRIGLIRLSPPRPGTDAPLSDLRWTRGSLRAWCASARVRDAWLVSSSRSQPTGFEPTPFAGHHTSRQILFSSRQEGTRADAGGCSRRPSPRTAATPAWRRP